MMAFDVAAQWCILSDSQLWRLLTLQDYNTRVVLAGTVLLGITSGLLGVYLLLRKRALLGDAISHATLPGIALAFQEAVVDVLTEKSLAALTKTGLGQLVVAGGVGANYQLRESLCHRTEEIGAQVFFPELEFCTDNGAMIAFAGAMRLQLPGTRDRESADAFSIKARWDLEMQIIAGI